MPRVMIRRFGEVLGVVLPDDIVREKGLVEGEVVEITIEKGRSVGEMWGQLRTRGVSTRALHRITDEGEDVR